MNDDNTPLSNLVAQGWELLHYTSSHDQGGMVVQNFLLRRLRQHRILSLRQKMMGKGYVATETDV